jgi:hypothetical protein
MIKFWEGKLIKKSVFTIVVSDGIADELQKIYKMDNRPVVIRSIPNKWSIDRSV